MIDRQAAPQPHGGGTDRAMAGVGAAASLASLFSAAACCVLPLALAGVGIGAGGLGAVVPFRWPLTIAAVAAVAIGWLLHLRKRRACATDRSCAAAPPARATFHLLLAATLVVALSSLWGFIEEPLLHLLGGA